jgi:hypothetical protein
VLALRNAPTWLDSHDLLESIRERTHKKFRTIRNSFCRWLFSYL